MSNSQSSAVIVTQNLNKQVASPEGQLSLLTNVNLSIFFGEAVAVVGASGAGKSTLLGLLAGMDTPTSGRIFLDGVEISVLDEDGRARLRAARVGFVFQAFHLLPNLTALENVALPLELACRGDALSVAGEVLERVGLAKRLHHYPKQLSGGEQQRVALARAFAPQPRLLFVDEPTGNLDSATGQRIIELLFTMNSEHRTTLVLVTHDESLAQRCSRRLELEAGRLKAMQ
jgi:putative ABC transport system ATP-binding protein